MADKDRLNREDKQQVAKIIATWIECSGLKRQSLSNMAGFPEYNLFYKAYLDINRPISKDPDRALGVVRAVTEGLAYDRRATADEVLRFLALTRFPHDRIGEVARLFPAGEWQAPTDGESGGGQPTGEDVAGRIVQLEAAIQRLLKANPSEEEVLAAATSRLASMPDEPPDPAPLPVPHRMPLPRGRLFTGRDDDLLAIMDLLRGQGPDQVIAITGLSGVGKTSLASELAHRCGQFFAGGVFWVSCAQPTMVALEVAACGETGLVERDDWMELPVEERARLVTVAWQSPLPRLLIFDNCEDDATLRRWRPTSGGCRVLLTSRRASWSRGIGVTTRPLRELDLDVATGLLRAYRPDLQATNPTLDAIARELGGLPLALHLAGSYLETFHTDPAFGDPQRFLADLQAAGPLVHDALAGVDVAPSPTDHELSVSRTFALSLERLRQGDDRDQLVRTVLARVAYLAPGAPFAVDLLATAAHAGEGVHRAARRLVDLGLVSEGEAMLRIHRLVADFARVAVDEPAAAGDMRHALIAHTEQIYAQRDAATARWLLPHLALHADDPGMPSGEQAIQVWNTMPFLLELGGDLVGGLAYLQRAQEALRQSETLESRLGAEVLGNLAEWHRALGDAGAARPLHEQALAIRQAILAPDDLAIAESHLNLGATLADEGSLDEAQRSYERALGIARRSGGPDHEITLAALNQVALLLFNQERYAEAREQFAVLAAATAQAFGADDPRTATVRNNLATVIARLGDYDAALVEFEVVVAIFQARLGDTHPETLRARLNTARALVQGGDPAHGAAALRPLIPLLAEAFGEEHLFTTTARTTLAECGGAGGK